jgi:hypothetical protein
MIWFDKLSQVLSAYYVGSEADPIVGYLQGSDDPLIWYKKLISERSKGQMLILGSRVPSASEWVAAGVAQRDAVKTIRLSQLAANGFMVLYDGAAPRPWGQIVRFEKSLEDNYEQNTLAKFRKNLGHAPAASNEKLVAAILALLSAIERMAKEYSTDHQSQIGLTTGSAGAVTGFFGYWTNHLFNTDPPPITIWNDVWSALAHARSLLREGKLGAAGRTTVDARAAFLQALGTYTRWKSGIETAGAKAQIAIGAVAFTLILAAAAATAATLAAEVAAGEAAATGSATATIENAGRLLTRADAAFVRVLLSDTGAKAGGAIFEYGEALEDAGETVEELLEACK